MKKENQNNQTLSWFLAVIEEMEIDLETIRKKFNFPEKGFSTIEKFEKSPNKEAFEEWLIDALSKLKIRYAVNFIEPIAEWIVINYRDYQYVHSLGINNCSLGIYQDKHTDLKENQLYLSIDPNSSIAEIKRFVENNVRGIRALQKYQLDSQKTYEEKTIPGLSKNPQRDEWVRWAYHYAKSDIEGAKKILRRKNTNLLLPNNSIDLTVRLLHSIGYTDITSDLVRKIEPTTKRKSFYVSVPREIVEAKDLPKK